MAAPNYVPAKPGQARSYQSPPRRDDSWWAGRPGDIPSGVPQGQGLGRQGPDQGYALKLVNRFEDQVKLAPSERWEDVAAGCVLIALKRASLFGRAPVIHDLEIAFRLWGYLDENGDPDQVDLRRRVFERVDNPHHYLEARRLTDAVPEDSLRHAPAALKTQHDADWAGLLNVDAFVNQHSSSDYDEYD